MPALSISTFCGLRSRWRMRWEWQKARPRRIWSAQLLTSGAGMPERNLVSRHAFRSWSRYSKTR
eukprot:scaffold39422_cov37-Tisochrysis_lutea.AAC.6